MKRSIRCLPIVISLVLLGGKSTQAGDLLDDAGAAFNRGDYTLAIKLFEEARARSKDCHIPFYVGLSQYRLQQLDSAIVNLASAASCNPQSSEFEMALAEAYIQKGDDNRALTTLEAVLKLDPQNVPALRFASILYLRHDLSYKALVVLESLVALDKNDARAAADLAAAYAAHSRFADAERLFTQALSISPQNVSALVGLGNLDFKSDRYEHAVDVLTRAIRLDPQTYEPFVLRARAYSRLYKYPDALADFQTALQLGARDPEIYYYLAQTYRAMGREEDSQRALAEFGRLRGESNRNVEAQREAARKAADARPLVDAGNLPGAVALLEQALDLDHGNATILFRLAGLYFENGQYDKAESSIQDAITIAPSQWDYHYLQGLIEKGVGHMDPARKSLETAVQLNPSAAEAHNQLGDLAMRRNDFAVAIEEFSRALQLAPGDAIYQSNLQHAKRLAPSQPGRKPVGP